MPFNTETGHWTPPAQHLTHYTLTNRRSNWNTTEVWWTNPELMAYTCDQSDDCDGFAYDGGNEHKGFFYFKSLNGNVPLASKPILSDNGTSTYLKNSTTVVRKANDPDTSDPSILPAEENTTSIDLYDQWSNKSLDLSVCGSLDNTGTVLRLHRPGIISYQSTAPFVTGTVAENIGLIHDRVGGYKIPIGWKFVFNATGNWFGGKDNPGHDNEGSHEFYDDRWTSDGDYHGCFNMDDPRYYAMNDKMSSGIIENIGFDVPSSWTTMGAKGISPGDEKKIKQRWCDSLTSTTTLAGNESRCRTAYEDVNGVTVGNARYDKKFLDLCKKNTNWVEDGECMKRVRNVIQNSSNADNYGTAQDMALTYCQNNRSSSNCGCINAHDLGFYEASNQPTCLTPANRNLPGCRDVVSSIGPIIIQNNNIISTIVSAIPDSGVMTDLCHEAHTIENSSVLPYESKVSFGTPTIINNFCSQVHESVIEVGASVKQTCDQTTIVNQYGTPTTTSGSRSSVITSPGTRSSSSGTRSSSSGTGSSSSGSDSKKVDPILIGGGIGACVCVFLLIIIAYLLSRDA